MKFRKTVSTLLSVIMMFTIIAPLSVAVETTPVVSVQSVTDTAGATVNVDVTIENNPGILGATLQFTYDNGLTLLDAVAGDAFSALTMTEPGKFTSPCNFVWDGQEIKDGDIKDGTILTLQFKINDNAEAGDEYAVNISYDSGDIFDADLNPIDIIVKSGSVGVVDYLPGDLDGDRNVNSRDIILLRRHVAGGYDQTVNESAGDVNNDGKKNSGDIILIRRYVAGGYDVVLKPSGPQCNHVMTEHPYHAPSCTENGTIAYWSCSACKKLFADRNGTTALTATNVVINATGHTVVIDPAVDPTYESSGLTEGKHCSVCDTIITKQETIPKLEKESYSVTYYIDNNDEYLKSISIDNPNPHSYSKEDGLVLQDLIVNGYNFIGWFTAQSGGTQVTEIAAGTTGNKTLYAHWEKVEYTVSFASDMVPQETITYTVGEERPLNKPKLDRYTFVGWSDKDGKIWDAIPAGTTGNITLYANWSSNRNKAVAKSTLGDPIICEDSNAGLILFTYEIGEIQNVPLYTILKLNCVNGIISSVSTTVSEEISSTQAKTIAQTISNATTNSSSWTLENNWNNSTEVSQSYLDQTGQTREEAESLAKSESGTYNLSSSKGGSSSYAGTSTGSYTLSGNRSHSDTTTTERGQNFDLSVDAKFSSETSVGASIPIEVVNLDVGAKYGFEIGAGADYGIYGKNTNSGTDGWSNGLDISKEKSKTTVAEKNWNTSEGYSNSKSTSTNSTVASAVSKLISEQYGYGSSYAEGGSNSNSQALASTDTKSDEYSTTMTYSTSKIQSTTKSIETTGNTFGDYRYVMAGTVHVFAVIGYDVAEQTYFVYTYNVMDDETYEYVDYSFDGTFNDYETSIIPFEIPHFVNDYVNTRIAKTSGLMIDPDTGVIVDYIPDSEKPDTIVIIPSYISIDNGDGTFKSVKVTGIADGLFKNNTNIVGVKLGNYITEIPDSAFEGCSSLQYVVAPGVTKISNNAFKGCTSLGEFALSTDIESVGSNAFEGVPKINAVAANAEVAQAVASSGAENIVLDISSIPENKSSNMSFDVANISSFELQGKDKEYKDLTVKSDATTTVINGVKFTDCTGVPMKLGSENVTLNRVTANAQGLALVITVDNAKVKLNQNVTLTSTRGNAVLCKNVSFASLSSGVVGKMTLTGDMLVASTSVSGENLIHFNSGEIKYITDEEFENYFTTCTITFDANGGSVDVASKSAAHNAPIGELPVPTRAGYTFVGWFTERDAGNKIEVEDVVTSNVILYAHWALDIWDGTSSEPAYNASTKTYTITTGSELAWVSDVTNGVITTGENFPNDISFSGYTIKLANDIYLNDVSNYENWETDAPKNKWKPIGRDITGKEFSGTFDGCDFCVYGMFYCAALFGYSNGIIQNLGVDKCHKIQEAGIILTNEGTVLKCYNKSDLTSCWGAGVVGQNFGTVTQCYNLGEVSNNTNDSVSGVVGSNNGTVEYCYNKGYISSGGLYVSGIARGGTVRYSYNKGTIDGYRSGGAFTSGIGGDYIENCHNLGIVRGEAYGNIGGIAAVATKSIARCYNAGTVLYRSADGGVLGAIFGSTYDANSTVMYCYSESARQLPIYGSRENGGIITDVKNLFSMEELSSFTGFSTDVWAVDPSINSGYPYLKALKDTY